MARATGVSRRAIREGIRDLQAPPSASTGRIRRAGGGRKRPLTQDPTLLGDLERLVEPVTRGDPASPVRWTCKSVRRRAVELRQQGPAVSHRVVAEALRELGDSRQAKRKTLGGPTHPDRDAQVAHRNRQVEAYLETGDPVISVDAQKKELGGPCKKGGRERRPPGAPEPVRVDDFVIPEWGRATPDGGYDRAKNTGWVSVGVDHDTAAVAVDSIRRWWNGTGRTDYPQTDRLLTTAAGGGSNGSRVRWWKGGLQQLADETGLVITGCPLPPGTSPWNKMEHRRLAVVRQNGRGQPLVSHEVIITLIAATTTPTGLRGRCQWDPHA